MDRKSKVILGNNLTSIILAIELSRLGYKVDLISMGKMGGHFKGVQFNNRNFDLGMILFEFSAFNNEINPDISTYNPQIKNDVGRFVAIVKEYISKIIDFREIESPQIFWKGSIYDDFLIANNINSLNKVLDDKQENDILNELSKIVENTVKSKIHAQHKSKDYFRNYNFREVSVVNHGETFHELFIEPFIEKVLNISSEHIIANYHRNAWVPLFYPETLLEQIKYKTNKLLKTKFHHPLNMNIGNVINILINELKSNDNVRLIENKISRFSILQNKIKIEFEDLEEYECEKLIWTLDGKALLNLLEEPTYQLDYERTDLLLCFINVEKAKLKKLFSIVNVLDDKYCIYRITNQSYLANSNDEIVNLSIEVNLSYLKKVRKTDQYKDIIEDELVSMKVIDNKTDLLVHEVLCIKNALILPTFNNEKIFCEMKNQISKLSSKVEVLGSCNNFLVNSMNDQIIEALKYVEQLKNKEFFSW